MANPATSCAQWREAQDNFLRVGFDAAERWRLYRLREDFEPAMKIIAEDDISASTVAPVRHTPKLGPETGASPQVCPQLRVPTLPTARRCGDPWV